MSSPAGTGAAVVEALPREVGPLGVAGIALTAAVVLLGAYVGYQAYRGYRRNDDRAVLFLGLGIVLVTTVRVAAPTVAYAFTPVGDLGLVALSFGVSIAGLLSILHAFTRG